MSHNNVFEEGSLVHLTVSVWGGRKKLPSKELHVEAHPDFVRGTKYLVDRDTLKPIEQARNSARGYLRFHSLPFPVTGICFIPKTMVERIDAKLNLYKEEFNRNVWGFVAQYENAKTIARLNLNGLFSAEDYPEDVASTFDFSWQFFAMTAPGKMSILNRELLKREEERFVRMMTEFRENAVNVLRLRFSEMVDRIVDRLSGEEKRFKNSTIGNLNEFLETFNHLNINNDVELQNEVNRCKEILAGVDPNLLRSDMEFRKGVAKKMTEVQVQVEAMMENRPKRLLWMEPEEETKAAA
jgi:hypothetical protein